MTIISKHLRFVALLALVVATVSSAFYFSAEKAHAQLGDCVTWETTYTIEPNPFPPGTPSYGAWQAVYGENRIVESSYQVARIDEDGGCGDIEMDPTVTASLVAVPATIAPGEQSSLSWSSMYATSCTGTNFSTGGATSGTILVTPGSTTNYSVTCTNGTQNATANATVTVSSNPPPPLVCEDATYQIGKWYNGGTQTVFWSETGESSANGGGLDNGGFYMNMCIAECESQGYGKCNFKQVIDLGESQASMTSFTCYGVTGSPTLIDRGIEVSGGPDQDIETSYTAITIPESCTTGGCVCDAIFYWNGSSWSLFQNTDPSGTCTLPPTPTEQPPLDPSAGTVNLLEYRDGLLYWGSTDSTYPDTSAHGSYDQGSCPLATGPNLSAGSISPTTAVVGTPVTLSSLITNDGSLTTGAVFSNLFQIDADSSHTAVTTTRSDSSSILMPGATDTSTVNYTFGTAGTWYARACADNNASFVGAITESNEADNCGAWTPITVTTGPGGVTSCTVSPSTITAGSSVTWSASPTNVGPYTWTPSEGGSAGGTGAALSRSYATAGTYSMSVTAGGVTRTCPNITVTAPVSCGTPNPTVTASPDRVTSGSTSTLTVSGSGVDTTCTVRNVNTNTVVRTLTATSCNVPTTTISTGSLTTQTTFSVTCGTVTDEVVVNVIPNFDEF